MKYSIHNIMQMAIMLVAFMAPTIFAMPLRGYTERFLGGNKFKILKAYFDPKSEECWFRYKIYGCSKDTVELGDVEEDGDTVTCTRTVRPKDSTGVKLPVDKSIKLSDAMWVNEVAKSAEVTWTKKKKLTVKMEKFTGWQAFYDPSKEKCTLEYKFKSTTTKIVFPDIEEDGNEVTCTKKKIDRDDLPIEDGLDDIDKKISNKNVEWVRSVVEKDAQITWEKGRPMKLHIERKPKPTDRDDFEDLALTYDEDGDEVVFEYEIVDGDSGKLTFEGDEVDRDGRTVKFEKCAEPPDLALPWKITFKESEVNWDTTCACTPDVDEAFFTWEEDSKCAGEGGDRRQLRRRARARGNIKLEGA